MPSPFPGMDPYLEEPSLWPDFHGSMLVAIRAALNASLPNNCRVTMVSGGGHNPARQLILSDRGSWTVVAQLELLNPYHKSSKLECDLYWSRRAAHRAPRTLVAIDLLREGHRLSLAGSMSRSSDYQIVVRSASSMPRTAVFNFGVRDVFPVVSVPLGQPDRSVLLDLKPCLDRTYDEGRYSEELPYTQPPIPPLPEPDATWARQLLAARHPGDPP